MHCRQTAWTVLEYRGTARPMSFALRRPVPLLALVRHNRAANTDPNLFLVDSSTNNHFRAVQFHCARACRKNLLALVELVSSPFATSLLKMMGHRRSSPTAAMGLYTKNKYTTSNKLST